MNTTNDRQESLREGAVIIAVEVQGSTGEKVIPDSSGFLEGDVLKNPNISKSSIRWVPRELIRFRARINQQAQRLLAEHGVSYYGGATLLPAAKLAEVEGELNRLEAQFNSELTDLAANLNLEVEAHKASNADIAHLIERFRETGSEFAGRFRFRQMPATNLDFVNGDASEAVASDMAVQLIEEVAKEAENLFKRTWSTVEKATAKTIAPVEVLYRKLDNLSFLDKSIEPIADAFAQAISAFPKSYPVTGEPVQEMAKFIAAASNIDTLRNFGQEAEDVDDEVVDTAQIQSQWPTLEQVQQNAGQGNPVELEAAPTENTETKPEVVNTTPAKSKWPTLEEVQSLPFVDQDIPVKQEVAPAQPIVKQPVKEASKGFSWGAF